MAELTVEPTIDSYLDQTLNQKRGASNSIYHGLDYNAVDPEVKDWWCRPIGNFDVSALAGATINSAKLSRYIWAVIGDGGWAASVNRCTRPSTWVETNSNWSHYDDPSQWTDAGGDFGYPPTAKGYNEASGTGWHDITGLKAFVEDALANRSGIVSVILVPNDEEPGVDALVRWYSKDWGSNVWKLVVDYTPAVAVRGFNMYNYW